MDATLLNLSNVYDDNRNNHIVCSTIPCADVMQSISTGAGDCSIWMAGIDEAGRGPVLGPMVYCACAVPAHAAWEALLKEFGCADSKTLSEVQRETIFARICNKTVWAAKIISPVYLSREMLRPQKVSLNVVSHDAARELTELLMHRIAKEANGSTLGQLFVDTVGPPEKYQQKLLEYFPTVNVKVSKKADSLFVTVSAASIIAKVIRDAVLKNWKLDAVVVTIGKSQLHAPPSTKRLPEGDDDDLSNASRKRLKIDIDKKDEELPTLPDASNPRDDNVVLADAEEFDAAVNEEGSASAPFVFGSGYPGDPKTKRYLAENCDPVFGFPGLVRFSWQTAQTLLKNSKAGPVLSWPDDMPEDQSWKPPTKVDQKQAGAMEKFIVKTTPATGGSMTTKKWKDAAFYRDNQLTLMPWPAV